MARVCPGLTHGPKIRGASRSWPLGTPPPWRLVRTYTRRSWSSRNSASRQNDRPWNRGLPIRPCRRRSGRRSRRRGRRRRCRWRRSGSRGRSGRLRTTLGHELLLRPLAGLNGCLIGCPLVVTLLRRLYVRGGARSRGFCGLRSSRGGRLGRRGRGCRGLPAAFGNEDLLGFSARLNGRLVRCPFVVALFHCFLLSSHRKRHEPEHRCRTNQNSKTPIHFWNLPFHP